MSDVEKMLAGYIKPIVPAAGDYTGPGGLLCCGKCHEPKEAIVDMSDAGDGNKPRHVSVLCRCQNAELAAEQGKKAKEQFDQMMERYRETFRIFEPSYDRCTFASDDSPKSKISVTCRRYVDRWEKVKAENIGILFYGSVGVGKSYYACAIVNALLERQVSAAVTNFPRLLNILQGTRDRQAVIDHLQGYDLLVLDDLGVERDTTYAAEQVYSVIDARARSRLPLIVTTNLTMEELKEPDTMQQKRIYDRILEMCPVPMRMDGTSRRIRNATCQREVAQEILGGQ